MKPIRKPDEMERQIILLAQRNAYLFVMAVLAAWTFYESWRVFAYHTPINLAPCAIMAAGSLVQGFSQFVMTRNAVKDDEDSYETGPLAKMVVWCCAAAGVIAVLVCAFVLMGVRL